MNTCLIIQSRVGSKRLRKKNLLNITKDNLQLIEIVILRLKQCKSVDKIILATSSKKENDVLIKIANKYKIEHFRGSENDTLSRFYYASKKFKADLIVRVTSDCALVDPIIVDKFINIFKRKKISYLSNTYHLLDKNNYLNKENFYPDGFDVEIFDFKTLEYVNKNLKQKDRLEGGVITPFFKKYPKAKQRFKLYIPQDNFVKKKNYKLSIDTKKDFNNVKKIFEYFHPNIYFSYYDVLRYLEKHKNVKSKNQDFLVDAKNLIIGENMLVSKNHNMLLPGKWPSYFSKTKGFYVWDLNNKKYADMCLMGVGTNVLGYSINEIDKAVIKNVKKGNLSTFNCPEEVLLAKKLIGLHPWFDKAKFTRSGGEANALAIRVARANTEKQNVAICGYHGWHDWYLSANLEKKTNLDQHLLSGLSPVGVLKKLKNSVYPFNYGDFEALKKLVNQKKIGIIKMEVCRSTKPNINFLKKIKSLCSKKKIILIFDECTTGFRECLGGLHKKIKIYPDICILGKTLGNGYAINAVLSKKDLSIKAEKSFISSTFWTERIGPTAALKTIELMEKKKHWKKINIHGRKIMNIWKSTAKKYNLKIKVFGIPSLAKFTFSNNHNELKTFMAQEFLKHGILASSNYYPCFSHNKNIIKRYKEILDKVFKKISQSIKEKIEISELIEGEISRTPFKRLN